MGYFLEVDVQYPEKVHELDHDLPFLPKRIKIAKRMKNFWPICMIEKSMLYTYTEI